MSRLFVYMLFIFIYLCYVVCVVLYCFFFFKQKTAYEMRISDWSSDVCSSDLALSEALVGAPRRRHGKSGVRPRGRNRCLLRAATVIRSRCKAACCRVSPSRHRTRRRDRGGPASLLAFLGRRSRDRKSTRLNSRH